MFVKSKMVWDVVYTETTGTRPEQNRNKSPGPDRDEPPLGWWVGLVFARAAWRPPCRLRPFARPPRLHAVFSSGLFEQRVKLESNRFRSSVHRMERRPDRLGQHSYAGLGGRSWLRRLGPPKSVWRCVNLRGAGLTVNCELGSFLAASFFFGWEM